MTEFNSGSAFEDNDVFRQRLESVINVLYFIIYYVYITGVSTGMKPFIRDQCIVIDM